MKKVIIFLSIILIIVLMIGVCIYIFKNSEKVKQFKDLIKYKTTSISDEKKLNNILGNLEFKDYMIKIEKQVKDNKEHLYIYYDCTDENEIMEYYRNYHKKSLIEKNSVTLFTLIDNLQQITYIFTISNIDFAKAHHLPVMEDKFSDTEYDYTREMIEKNYNQDVRNYIEEPDKFMNYNIDLNISKLTIYYRDEVKFDVFHAIEIEDKDVIGNIAQYIETKNFDVPDGGWNGMCNTWLDLNNGYLIGVYGSGYDGYGAIAKGNGEEIFKSENPNVGNIIHKQLPEGLTEYVENLIKSYKEN